MHQPLDPLPQLHQAPLQYRFQRIEDFCCWTQPLFQLFDCDPLRPRTAWHSSHRDVSLGTLNLSRTDYGSGMQLSCRVEDQVIFDFNGYGSTRYVLNRQVNTPEPGSGVMVVTPIEAEYVRGKGGGIVLSTRQDNLLQTARSIQGPLAEKRLRQRLQQPLQFFAYGSGVEPSLSRSLQQSLHLVDSLLSPKGSLPAALRLDDLICRQLVLMLCPELSAEEAEAGPEPASADFERLLEWASSQVATPLSLSELEARSGYSRRALQRAFQQRFGCGPMQWLQRRRLELALEQLSRAVATDSVSSIARRCGYLNLASFSRDFSRVYGRKPSEILRANQQRPAP
jgi:AraC-like DNA-binding protein